MNMKNSILFSVLCLVVFPFLGSAQELALYSLDYFDINKKDNFGFVSLSDNYQVSEHKDSLALPDISKIKASDAHYLKLEGKYRKRFLNGTKLSENDLLYAYDYAQDVLLSFPVKNLDVVACLSLYVSDEEFPFSQSDYMIGFRINTKDLKGFSEYYGNNYVYVGKSNPFIKGALKAMVWRKIASKEFPSKAIGSGDAVNLGKYALGDAYKFEANNFVYYLRDLKNSQEVFARRLLVLDSKNKKILYERVYQISEGGSLVPLAIAGKPEESSEKQWTGKFLKGRPDAVFGFLYASFGCEGISFLKQDVSDVYINCDNRH